LQKFYLKIDYKHLLEEKTKPNQMVLLLSKKDLSYISASPKEQLLKHTLDSLENPPF